MNVLLTGVGRRNFLVQFFKEALGARGLVFACDCSRGAPALFAADRHFHVPRFEEPGYLAALLAICKEHAVRLLCASNDLELALLADNARRFRAIGTIPVVAAPHVIALCQDKWAAFGWLRSIGLGTPDTFASLADARRAIADGRLAFPLLIKPRFGTSSIGVERVDNERELQLAYEWGAVQLRRTILTHWANGLLIQPFLTGPEYGIDIVNDLHGHYAGTLARRKLVMRSGNTDRAVTVVDPAIERVGAIIGTNLGHLGGLDCDLIETPDGHNVLDLNPRLGGGYPFSHLAGANLPAALLAWANGQEADPAWLRQEAGVYSSRYDGIALVEPDMPSCKPNPLSAPVPISCGGADLMIKPENTR